jgi:hypothetical protein
MSKLNGVFIIPTGLGCSLGGDAAFLPGVKLIAECCNDLIVNPNSVNASDINEMPSNCLYVEGSIIDRFFEGKINLRKTKTFNRILMVVNPPVRPNNINAMNAGMWALGTSIKMLTLNTPLRMKVEINKDGTAGGTYSGIDELVKQVEDYGFDFDALAIQTPIEYDKEIAEHYWLNGGVNPWGGIEAIVSRIIAERINKPIAHAPPKDFYDSYLFDKQIVKKSMAPEVISNTYTFCILKGLHRAPKVELDLSVRDESILTNKDFDFLVTPHGCFGRPHIACIENNIPIIVVKENTTCFSNLFEYPTKDGIIFVNNYLEAAGVIMSMTAGVDFRSVLMNEGIEY